MWTRRRLFLTLRFDVDSVASRSGAGFLESGQTRGVQAQRTCASQWHGLQAQTWAKGIPLTPPLAKGDFGAEVTKLLPEKPQALHSKPRLKPNSKPRTGVPPLEKGGTGGISSPTTKIQTTSQNGQTRSVQAQRTHATQRCALQAPVAIEEIPQPLANTLYQLSCADVPLRNSDLRVFSARRSDILNLNKHDRCYRTIENLNNEHATSATK